MKKAENIKEYIQEFPPETQILLNQLWGTIKKAAPEAHELISYGMPAFKKDGILLYFAGYKNHIGLYPCRSAMIAFEEDFKKYKRSVGAVQFTLNKPIPKTLVTKIVRFRLKENHQKAMLKKK